ncbi:molybdopterin-guanine dinucleotide biosynthesis protein B [Thiomonas sp. FB-6]|uniref:molybdopterin-guanine dinucleotide biosynthesis protein B n=1 Tax=Thiomonas sp. FB-6 TaxID=1158291 RepID=UPI00036F5A07|nr:molybdopterin-guanine dinucleotide biosynthesis protein B [Thiomonas sp. FB-6]
MFVAGFVGFSGAGKTTLIEALLGDFAARGLRASVIKHAHHGFELDREGKDSWRHRKAGAYEVLVASPHLLALQRETREAREYELPDLLRRLDPVDWVFVEGFRQAPISKIEVWRAGPGKPRSHAGDPLVRALASDGPLPPALQQAGAGGGEATPACPLLDLRRPGAISAWLIEQRAWFRPPPA